MHRHDPNMEGNPFAQAQSSLSSSSSEFWRPSTSSDHTFTENTVSEHSYISTQSPFPSPPPSVRTSLLSPHNSPPRHFPMGDNIGRHGAQRQVPRTMGDYLQPGMVTAPSCITFSYNAGNFHF